MAGFRIHWRGKADLQIFPSGGTEFNFRLSNNMRNLAGKILAEASKRVGDTYSGTGPLGESNPLSEAGQVVPDPGNPLRFNVVFKHPIAYLHHEGTKSHIIRAKNKGGKHAWRLYNDKTEPPFEAYFWVWHPGSTGNPFLVDAAHALGLTIERGRTRELTRGSALRSPIRKSFTF